MDNQKNTKIRWISYLLGIFILNTGISFTIRAGIGISPISSLTRTMTVVYPPITQGTYAFLLNCIMFLAAFIVLPKDFKVQNFAQLIPAFISGMCLDINLKLFENLHFEPYFANVALLVTGCSIVAMGLFLMINANLLLMPMDAFISVVVKRTHRQWGNIKSITDCTMLAVSATIGLVFCGQIMFIREGTLINAIVCGQFVKLYMKLYKNFKNNSAKVA